MQVEETNNNEHEQETSSIPPPQNLVNSDVSDHIDVSYDHIESLEQEGQPIQCCTALNSIVVSTVCIDCIATINVESQNHLN